MLRFLLWGLGLLVTGATILVGAVGVGYLLPGDSDSEHAAWAQAVGAVFAIVAGFVVTLYQLSQQKADEREAEIAAGKAAFRVAHNAFETVRDRLNAALTPPDQEKELALRGARADEMVHAMREFDMIRLPVSLLPDFVVLRSVVAAINARLHEVYRSEEKVRRGGDGISRDERHNRLASAVKAY